MILNNFEVILMAKKKEITFSAYITIDGAEPVPWESLSEKEIEDVKKQMSKNLSERMSAYFTAHPEQYDLI